MTAENWSKLEALFHEALELSEAERAAFVDQACPPGDPLRGELESLLESEAPSRHALQTPPARIAADLLEKNPRAFRSGQRIGQYEIEELVATGGMGEIYRASDPKHRRRVALKILRPHLTVNAQAVHRFETEAAAASALRHPNIITIHDFGRLPEGLFIAMEWVDGNTWRERMRPGEPPFGEAIRWASQTASALEAAHLAGILHRDIKPENLMVRRDGAVKVLDFGLARLTQSTQPAPASSAIGASGTISGTLSGTLLYMSPEILRGEAATAASDVFSFGAVLYELFSGVHPFAGETPLDILEAIECRAVRPPSALRESIPAELDALILAMLDREPARRPAASGMAARF